MPSVENENHKDDSNNSGSPGPARLHHSGTKKNLVYSLLINMAELWRSSSKTIDRLLEDYGAYEILDFIIAQLSRHPFLAFGMSICVLSCALPFIVFMVFAIATVIMTFTGFVIIEGTLITIASALLFGFLGAVILFFLFFGFVLLAGYFGLMQIYDLIDYPGKRRAVVSYLRRNGRDAQQTDSVH